MLNFTDQQVEDFKKWEKESVKKVEFMQAVIRQTIPKGYEKNDFFQRLEQVRDEISTCSIRNNGFAYEGKEICTEIRLGSCLRQMICDIRRYMNPSALLENQITQLEEMFEI